MPRLQRVRQGEKEGIMKEHHKYQYVVVCRRCGIQPLSHEDYLSQMRRADSKWECPCCGEDASWDDDSLETNPAEPPCDGPPEQPPPPADERASFEKWEQEHEIRWDAWPARKIAFKAWQARAALTQPVPDASLRERFEAWARSVNYKMKRSALDSGELSEFYYDDATQRAWNACRAARNQPCSKCGGAGHIGGLIDCPECYQQGDKADIQKMMDSIRSMSALITRREEQIDALVNHCPNNECSECARIVCQFGDPMHLHHDGCPSCACGDRVNNSRDPLGLKEIVSTPPNPNTPISLTQQCLELCYQIEKCGASPELTEASIMAAALHERLKYPTGTMRIAVRNADAFDDEQTKP